VIWLNFQRRQGTLCLRSQPPRQFIRDDQAVQAGQIDMLRHLLTGCGQLPNYRPHAAPIVALPPASFAICALRATQPRCSKVSGGAIGTSEIEPVPPNACF
jgi:hypothetical protein